jgi:predicted kinase
MTIHIIVGNIASGKTTLARKLAKSGAMIISLDALRWMRAGGEYEYDEKWEPILRRSEEKILETAMFYKTDIVLDDARFVLASHRHVVARLAKEKGYTVVTHVMPRLSMQESVERRLKENFNQKITKKTWENVWKKFDVMYVEPSEDEGIIIKHMEGSDA